MSPLPHMADLYGAKAAGLLEQAFQMVEKVPDHPGRKLDAFNEAAAFLATRACDQWLPRDVVATYLQDEIAGKNDYFGLGDRDTQRVIDAVMAGARVSAVRSPSSGPSVVPLDASSTVILTSAASITPGPIRWLWRHYLACGKMHLLGGAPSAGKTTLALALAAIISKGGTFPDGTKASVGRVIMWSGEDDPADTLIPRLEAAGADLNRVHFVDGVREARSSRSFVPSKDIPALEKAIRQYDDVALLIVDPVVSLVAGDGHKNSDVRIAFQPLLDMIARLDIAAVGITHFTKGTSGRDPVERITGSLAFAALSRVVLVAAKEEVAADSDDGAQEDGRSDRRILSRAKSNIGPDGGGFAYRVEPVAISTGGYEIETTRIVWGEELHGSAREILGSAEASQEEMKGALAEACDFLRVKLEYGPVLVTELQRRAKAAGISDRTLKRASSVVGVKKDRDGFGPGGKWVWRLKDQPA